MDKPTTPAGPDASKSPWPEDSGSEPGFGATGVFGVVNEPEPVEGWAAGPGAAAEKDRNRLTEAQKPQPALGAQALAEPVVHKVVFGGGAEESSQQLLDRIRLASAERAPGAERAPAAAPGVQGSAGFTELLRTLGSDSPAPAVAAREIPPPETRGPAPVSGFTSLLQTLSATEAATTPAEDRLKTMQPDARSIPAEPGRAAAGPTPGGFTELLRTTAAESPEYGGPQTQRPGLGEAPGFGGAGGAIPPPSENKPGTFTQLFGTLGGAEASPAGPAPVEREMGGSSGGSAGSFTRMLSLEPQPVAAEPAYREERQAAPGSVDYGLTPGTAGPATPSRDPFSQPLPEAQPVPSAPPVAGVGITRLIQMLDEPSRPSAPPMEVPPVSPPQGAQPGVWTQTFASLSTPNEPTAPAAKAPDWPPPPPAPAVAGGYAAAREAHFPTPLSEPPVRAVPAASAPSGPSEFTRILDASKLREMSMRGGQAVENPVPAPPAQSFAPPVPQSFAPAPPAVPIPNYPVAPPPPPAGMQGLRGMPLPSEFRPPHPPQPPAYPMSYPQGGAIHAPGGGLPQAPGMYAPPPIPAPPVPQAPPVKPIEPGMGKLQQFVPMLLVLIIVLLVVLLVTVIFLLKH